MSDIKKTINGVEINRPISFSKSPHRKTHQHKYLVVSCTIIIKCILILDSFFL